MYVSWKDWVILTDLKKIKLKNVRLFWLMEKWTLCYLFITLSNCTLKTLDAHMCKIYLIMKEAISIIFLNNVTWSNFYIIRMNYQWSRFNVYLWRLLIWNLAIYAIPIYWYSQIDFLNYFQNDHCNISTKIFPCL